MRLVSKPLQTFLKEVKNALGKFPGRSSYVWRNVRNQAVRLTKRKRMTATCNRAALARKNRLPLSLPEIKAFEKKPARSYFHKMSLCLSRIQTYLGFKFYLYRVEK